jgi:hypothetical protein
VSRPSPGQAYCCGVAARWSSRFLWSSRR